jgi:hypothetical protein
MADLRQRLRVEATLKDGVSRGLDGIRKSSEKSLGNNGGLAAHAGAAKLELAALVTGVTALGVGLFRTTRDVARQNDEIAKMSLRLGTTTEALSQLRFVSDRSGVSFNTMTMGLQRMTRRVAEAAQGTGEAVKALRELNISARDLSQLRPEDQFEHIADALHGLNTQSDRVRLAMKLFDSEGVALVQTMGDGAEGIRKLRAEADALGITLSAKAAKEAEQFQDQITNITTAADGLRKVFAEGVIKELGNFQTAMAAPDMKASAEQFGGLIGALTTKALGLVSVLTAINTLRTQMTPADVHTMIEAATASNAETARLTAAAAGQEFGFSGGSTFLGSRKAAGNTAATTAEPTGIRSALPSLHSIGMSPVSGGAIRAGESAGKGYGLGFARGLEDTTGKQAGTASGSILQSLTFGRNTDSQAVIERLADTTGDRTAAKALQGWRARTAKDGDLDVVQPFAGLATTAGGLFVDNLGTSLTLGLADFILEGDLESATKVFGATLAAGMAVGAAEKVSGKITDKLVNFGADADPMEMLASGKKVGGKIVSGINTSFDSVTTAIEGALDIVIPPSLAGLNDLGSPVKGNIQGALGIMVPETFSSQFNDLGSGVKGNITDAFGVTVPESFINQFDGVGSKLHEALAGGIVGLGIGKGIGTLIGDEIIEKGAMIGGALGGAFAGPVGSIIGSITGALAGKLPGMDGLITDLFGLDKTSDSANAGIADLGTDIQAFGGLTGFFQRINGFAGIRGQRKDAIESDKGGSALERIIRMTTGATKDQASDALQAIRSAGVTPEGPIQFQAKSSLSELINILRKLGFSEADIARINVVTGDAGNTDGRLPGDFELGGVGKPTGKQRLSISKGVSSYATGGNSRHSSRFTAYLSDLGTAIGDSKGNNIADLIEAGGNNQGARAYLSSFYDIVAAKGYHGVVNGPTTILAGEAGPERVDISPGGAGFQGGASSGNEIHLYYTANINAMDASGVDRAAAELGDRLRETLLAMSSRGEPVVYSTGVVTVPSV